MTMVMILGNSDQMIQVSDRRLSSKSKVVHDSFNKATYVSGRGGRFSVGFTGIATYKEHNTQRFLVDSIYEIMPMINGDVRDLPGALADKLSDYFKSTKSLLELSDQEKRLTVVLAGYLSDANPPALAEAMITNFQDFLNFHDNPYTKEQFDVVFEIEKADPRPTNPTLIQRIGAWPFTTDRDIKALQQALENRLPAPKIIEMASGIIRRISDESEFLVGKDISSITIPRNFSLMPSGSFHPAEGKNVLEMPDSIIFDQNSNVHAITGMQIGVQNPDTRRPVFKPKVGRNQRCPCKSGKKYKRCCGA